MTIGRLLIVAVSVTAVGFGLLALVGPRSAEPTVQPTPTGRRRAMVASVDAAKGVRSKAGFAMIANVPAFQTSASAPVSFAEAEAREPAAAGITMKALQTEVQQIGLDVCMGQSHPEVVRVVFRYNVRSSSDEIAFGLPEMMVLAGKLSHEEYSCIGKQFERRNQDQRIVRPRDAAFLSFNGVVEVPAEYGIAR